MHPEFDGQILSKLASITELPTRLPKSLSTQTFTLKSCDNSDREWTFSSKLIRIGRRSENDVTVEEPWVSKEHAEIIQLE